MNIVFAVVLGLVVGGIVAALLLRRQKKGPEDGSLLLLQNQLATLSKVIDERLGHSNREMQEAVRAQFSESQKLIRDITTEITHVKETNRHVVDVAAQLKSLQQVLQNPKQRGVLGEYYLETVLKNVLPPGMYQMQFPFANGEIVDAVVFLDKKIIPIDSKFSLENYNRLVNCEPSERVMFEKAFVNDLKMRIQETSKYIRPEENTMDFAFMFIPSEGIYYDLLVNSVGAGEEENLIQRAASKYKVVIVSPTSFLAYLQTVLQGLRALKIEEKAVEIQKRVGELGKHLSAYNEYMLAMGKSLGTTVNHFNKAHKELGKIDKDVLRISGESDGIEMLTVDRPGDIEE